MLIFFSILVAFSALTYLWAVSKRKTRWIYTLKPGTMVFIIALALWGAPFEPPAFGWWILIGLLFSLVGDIFLMLPKNRFLFGLIAFLIAHVCYVIGFIQKAPLTLNIVVIVVLVLSAVLFIKVLTPGVLKQGGGKLLTAVVFYVVLISAMVVTAVSTGESLLIIAAVLFFLSDATLAWDRFVHPLKYRDNLVMSTYFLAQYLFALSLTIS
ncbi:lysoplasmalogenase [Bacillus sp. THAF10]|uniref:lysoplasmalogenase n=1 Tax=Bacillus sp. THAF10 TaxID=2587848 RepID=UPI001562AA83|nr:lysoplasmalogenase [Bacillus sp. THAF10]